MFQLYWVIKIFFFIPLFKAKLLRNNGVYCFDDDGGGDGGDSDDDDDDDSPHVLAAYPAQAS